MQWLFLYLSQRNELLTVRLPILFLRLGLEEISHCLLCIHGEKCSLLLFCGEWSPISIITGYDTSHYDSWNGRNMQHRNVTLREMYISTCYKYLEKIWRSMKQCVEMGNMTIFVNIQRKASCLKKLYTNSLPLSIYILYLCLLSCMSIVPLQRKYWDHDAFSAMREASPCLLSVEGLRGYCLKCIVPLHLFWEETLE